MSAWPQPDDRGADWLPWNELRHSVDRRRIVTTKRQIAEWRALS